MLSSARERASAREHDGPEERNSQRAPAPAEPKKGQKGQAGGLGKLSCCVLRRRTSRLVSHALLCIFSSFVFCLANVSFFSSPERCTHMPRQMSSGRALQSNPARFNSKRMPWRCTPEMCWRIRPGLNQGCGVCWFVTHQEAQDEHADDDRDTCDGSRLGSARPTAATVMAIPHH